MSERCWNTIGVWGNQLPRCHLLDETIHCRNCSVFIQAGRALLDWPLDHVEQWTPAPSSLIHQGRFYLCFRLYTEFLAITSQVLEHALDCCTIHSLPNRKRDALLGLVNVRGRLEVCLSLASVLHVTQDDSPYTRMLVVARQGQSFVIPVSQVLGLERLQVEAANPTEKSHGYIRTITPIKGREVGILDEERVFDAFRGCLGR